MNISRILIFLSLVSTLSFGSSDSEEHLNQIELKFFSRDSNPATITIKYKYYQPNRWSASKKKIGSMTVKWRGVTIEIPEEELVGISDIQVDSMTLHFGKFRDGPRYHYIKALYGKPEKEGLEGYKQVQFMMRDQYIERRTSISIRINNKTTYDKPLTIKPRGKKETNMPDEPADPHLK